MKLAEIAEIIREKTGCDPHIAFLTAVAVKTALRDKENRYGRN
jgi:hypothetical protein